jgi:outer membrane protein TolC
MTFSHKKETEGAQDRYQEMVSGYDKQIREMRAQVSLKGKDLHNQREDISDLEQRLQQKTSELRNTR